jgi:hypothetical protein
MVMWINKGENEAQKRAERAARTWDAEAASQDNPADKAHAERMAVHYRREARRAWRAR